MSADIDSKKRYFVQDIQGFKEYVTQKYLIHMSDHMVLRVFRAFWKFEFILDDEACRNNRKINFVLFHTNIIATIGHTKIFLSFFKKSCYQKQKHKHGKRMNIYL